MTSRSVRKILAAMAGSFLHVTPFLSGGLVRRDGLVAAVLEPDAPVGAVTEWLILGGTATAQREAPG